MMQQCLPPIFTPLRGFEVNFSCFIPDGLLVVKNICELEWSMKNEKSFLCVPSSLVCLLSSLLFLFLYTNLPNWTGSQIPLIYGLYGLRCQFNKLNRPKSHQQWPTSANGVGHTTITGVTDAHWQPDCHPGVSRPLPAKVSSRCQL